MKLLYKFTAFVFFLTIPLSAFVVIEDFNYPSIATGGSLAGSADGGVGWSGGWEGNLSVFYHSTINLTYPDYPLSTDTDSGSLYSNISNYRAVYRSLGEVMDGELWFSYVFRKGGTGQGGLMFNANIAHTTGAPTDWSILLDAAGTLNVNVKGQISGVADIVNAIDYLVIGRVVSGTASEFQIWINPDLNAVTGFEDFLVTVDPVYTYDGAVELEPIESLGLAAFRGAGASSVMRIDSLRLSDGGGDPEIAFQEITGVTERPEDITNPWNHIEPVSADGWKQTPFGLLVDRNYPHVWFDSWSEWVYVVGDQSEPETILGYDYDREIWFWAGVDWSGYRYEFVETGPEWAYRGQ